MKIIKKINSKLDIDIIPTFLGAHDIPPEYIKNKHIYIDLICNKMIPQIAKEKLAVFCDVFCEPGYFNLKETEVIVNKAKEYNLKPRLHVDEFVDSYFRNRKPNYFGWVVFARNKPQQWINALFQMPYK